MIHYTAAGNHHYFYSSSAASSTASYIVMNASSITHRAIIQQHHQGGGCMSSNIQIHQTDAIIDHHQSLHNNTDCVKISMHQGAGLDAGSSRCSSSLRPKPARPPARRPKPYKQYGWVSFKFPTIDTYRYLGCPLSVVTDTSESTIGYRRQYIGGM